MSQPERPSPADEIAHGRALSRSGDDDAAVSYFQEILERHPDDAVVWAEYAYCFDRAGREEKALGPYRRALGLGLPDDYLPGHLLGLGSTLRNVGRHEEAVAVLENAVERFPDYAALRVFLALARQSNGQADEALVMLLDLILASPGIDLDNYERAIRLYADELRG